VRGGELLTAAAAAPLHVPLRRCTVKERLGGKYVSMTVAVMVRAPELIQMVWEELGKDERVKMRY
jgi:putative lipoic acid-binding regulatory protein